MAMGLNYLKRGFHSDFTKSLFKCGATLALAVATVGLTSPTQATTSYMVQTKEGPVRGFLGNRGVVEFLGIPYAAPPLGNLRWRPPQAHASWTKTLQATAYGPTCAQINELAVYAGPANDNADCLYLNVFTPDANPTGKEKLPVIFWIHGGGSSGESNDYDGSKLAAQGHTVVVTINYRLGLLGFFAHPAIDKEGHFFGNYGLLDQQFALKWVQANIAAFGGDRSNVTVGGQSAGSLATQAHVVSPLAKGLFNRAIFQTGESEPSPLAAAESKGAAFAVAAGCGSGDTPAAATCLRKLSVAQIMALQGTASTNGPYLAAGDGLIADGQILPSSVASAISAGQFNHMPILSGDTEDEWTFLLAIPEYWEKPRVPYSAADYSAIINGLAGSSEGLLGSGTYPSGTPAAVKSRYPLNAYSTPELALERIFTDAVECEQHAFNRLFASQVPVYAYEFDDRTAPSYFPPLPGMQMLAYHTGDIQYLFPLYHGGPLGIVHQLNRQQENLSDELVAAWTNFAWTGNPNGQGNQPWPLFTPNRPNAPSILSENSPALTPMTDAAFAAAHQCKFWDSVLTY